MRGFDAYVVQSMCAPVNNNLVELLIMVDALRRASADRITAVVPYFGYARQEKKTAGREPISAKLVANLMQVSGVSRVLTVDLHAAAIEGFFRHTGRPPAGRRTARPGAPRPGIRPVGGGGIDRRRRRGAGRRLLPPNAGRRPFRDVQEAQFGAMT